MPQARHALVEQASAPNLQAVDRLLLDCSVIALLWPHPSPETLATVHTLVTVSTSVTMLNSVTVSTLITVRTWTLQAVLLQQWQ